MKTEKKIKCKIINTAEGIAEGLFECTEEQFKFIKSVLDCQGNFRDDGYSGRCHIEKN